MSGEQFENENVSLDIPLVGLFYLKKSLAYSFRWEGGETVLEETYSLPLCPKSDLFSISS